MRVPSLLLCVAAFLALSPAAHALVTIDNVSLTGSANAGADSDDFSAMTLSGVPLNAAASDMNGLSGEALASATLTASLTQQAGGEDTTIDISAGVLASAVGLDAAGAQYTADATVSAVVGFTLDTDHWLEVVGDNYYDALRRLSDNQVIDLTTATQLDAGAYELAISDGASALDSAESFDGYLSLRLYTIPEPTSCVLVAALLLCAACGHRTTGHQQ